MKKVKFFEFCNQVEISTIYGIYGSNLVRIVLVEFPGTSRLNIFSHPLVNNNLHTQKHVVWAEAFQPVWWRGVGFGEPCSIKKTNLLALWKRAIKCMLS